MVKRLFLYFLASLAAFPQTATFSTSGGFLIGEYPFSNGAPAFVTTLTIDEDEEQAGCVFQTPVTGVLQSVHFPLGATTLDASSVARISFQNLSGGLPDNTEDAYFEITSVNVASYMKPTFMTSDGTSGGTKLSVTQGDVLVYVLRYSTFTGTNNLILRTVVKQIGGTFPYCVFHNGTSWAKSINTLAEAAILEYFCVAPDCPSETTPHPLVRIPHAVAYTAINTVDFGSGSSPDERGIMCTPTAPVRIRELEGWIDPVATGRNFDIVMYQVGSDTPLATMSKVADNFHLNTLKGGPFVLPSSVAWTVGNSYRLVTKPTTTGAIRQYEVDFDSAAARAASSMLGQWCVHTSRTDGATTGGTLGDGWVQTDTKLPIWAIRSDQMPDGTGGSGGTAGVFVTTQ